MGEGKVCNCETKHHDHICILKRRGLTYKVKQLTGNPNVACLRCGELAKSKDNVCLPAPLFI